MPILIDVVGGVNVQRQQLCLVELRAVLNDAGQAAGQRQVLVEQLEGVGQSQEGAGGDGGHHVGDDDPEQRLAAAGTVNFSGLQHVSGDGLKPGNVNDHHVADLLPGHQNDQTPEAVGGVGGEVGGIVPQNAVKNHAPYVAQHHAADQVGHEEHGAKQVGAAHLLGQGIGDEEGQHIDQENGDHGEKCGVLEGVPEADVRPDFGIIRQADPFGILGNIEGAEGQVDALQKRPDEADAEGSEHGEDEQRRPPLNGTADQSAVQAGAVIFFAQ